MYVELHAHSAYSFLDGASLPEELAARAAELGYEALALTDHDGVYGSLEFAHAAKAFGVRPITGAEVSLRDGSHVTLLVESAVGYANLCRLLTAAHAHTRDGLDLALVCIADRIDFLQRNDVRVQLREHIYDSFETDAAIYSASLVNVVGNNPHGKFTCV